MCLIFLFGGGWTVPVHLGADSPVDSFVVYALLALFFKVIGLEGLRIRCVSRVCLRNTKEKMNGANMRRSGPVAGTVT